MENVTVPTSALAIILARAEEKYVPEIELRQAIGDINQALYGGMETVGQLTLW